MMLDLRDIEGHVADQDRGAWFDLRDPVEGAPTGIRFCVAGPDSMVQRRAQLRLAEDLIALAAYADARGRPVDRESASLACLARCVVGWEIMEDGQPIPFNHINVMRVLSSARWVQAQVDDFAGRRPAFAVVAR